MREQLQEAPRLDGYRRFVNALAAVLLDAAERRKKRAAEQPAEQTQADVRGGETPTPSGASEGC